MADSWPRWYVVIIRVCIVFVFFICGKEIKIESTNMMCSVLHGTASALTWQCSKEISFRELDIWTISHVSPTWPHSVSICPVSSRSIFEDMILIWTKLWRLMSLCFCHQLGEFLLSLLSWNHEIMYLHQCIDKSFLWIPLKCLHSFGWFAHQFWVIM